MISLPTSQALHGGLPLLGLAVLFSGCVQVGPKDFNIPSRGLVAEVNHPVAAPRAKCPKLPPIPDTVHISIEPGQPVIADQGGELLLRAYVEAREWAKTQVR